MPLPPCPFVFLLRSEPDPVQLLDVDVLPTHHAEFFEGVEDKPGEMLIMVVEVLVVPWTL